MKLVVTHYNKYPPETVENYFKSLRVLDADTKVCFITEDVYGVQARVKGKRVEYVVKDAYAKQYPCCISRFFALRDVLRELRPTKVLFSDCRDFVLMEEPFQYIDKNVVVSEERKTPATRGSTNYNWAVGISDRVAEYLAGYPVICAGMLAGINLLPLLDIFTVYVAKIGGGKPIGEHIDQPLIGYLVRSSKIAGWDWTVLPEENKVCQHLGSECFDFRKWMPAMVHGYPMYADLQREIETRIK